MIEEDYYDVDELNQNSKPLFLINTAEESLMKHKIL